MRSKTRNFAATAKQQQLQWAAKRLPPGILEIRNGEPSWVLKREHRTRNMFRPQWWDYLVGKEHTWARALNSSQCFGVNLFAPLAEDPGHARSFVNRLLPGRGIELRDMVKVYFEHTPDGAPGWLGESGQPTQVDVFFEITRGERQVGFVLVEVKYSEPAFGGCRGWNGKRERKWSNPERARCENAAGVVTSPETQCWLAETQGRQYWKMLSQSSSSLRIQQIGQSKACPFRHGLYQMMRNRVLADELSRQTPGAWSEFAVCRHPENRVLTTLIEPVAGSNDSFAAFRTLSSPDAVGDWNAQEVLDLIGTSDLQLPGWKTWMEDRYFSKNADQLG